MTLKQLLKAGVPAVAFGLAAGCLPANAADDDSVVIRDAACSSESTYQEARATYDYKTSAVYLPAKDAVATDAGDSRSAPGVLVMFNEDKACLGTVSKDKKTGVLSMVEGSGSCVSFTEVFKPSGQVCSKMLTMGVKLLDPSKRP